MQKQKRLILFIFSFILPLIFYRIYVFSKSGSMSYLREITGLQVHHYHYGIICITIALILIIFNEISIPAIFFGGFGLGTVLDGFISSMFTSTTRIEEIINYNNNLIPTIFLFMGVLAITITIYQKEKRVIRKRLKKPIKFTDNL